VQLALTLTGGAAAAVTLARRYPRGEVCRIEVSGIDRSKAFEFVAPPDGNETIGAALRAQAEDFARNGGEGATLDDAVAALEAAERARAALGLASVTAQ
jgi:hypothetical protein